MKIAIVGGAPSSECLAPFTDPSFEIWAHGNQMQRHEGRRITRIFEIHDDLSDHQPEYARWLVSMKIPLIVGRKFPLLADHVTQFRYEAANAIMGQHLTSTPAYMMATAILEGATHISIFGVDMSVDDHEYFYQRPSMYAWIAYAKAKGIEVYIPPESGLFRDDYVEGDKSGKPDLALAPFTCAEFARLASMHADKIADCEQQILGLQMRMNAYSGAKQTYERLAKIARGVEAGAVIQTLTGSVLIK